jgi:MoxR-like ATPase
MAAMQPGQEQEQSREQVERLERAKATADRLLANIETVVHGKTERIQLVLAALACRGHVLFEDVPGTAKTVLARAIAASVTDATTSRIQCTPDLQPTDVTGLSVYNQQTRDFEFRAGPVFASILLVDEINRAMPKTQSALLEAMGERQVTVDGVTRQLPDPFLLLATENPIEQEGTFPLPEAQLDRFFLRTELGYPTVEQEMQVVREQRQEHPLARLRPVVSLEEVRELEVAIEDVYTNDLLLRWIVELVQASRDLDPVALGASVRASLALERMARAWALLHGRDYVMPEDVETLFLPVMGHRIVFTPTFVAETRRLGRDGALSSFRDLVLSRVPRPEPSQERELRVLTGFSS